MDDVADCLLSVAWTIFPLMGKPPARPEIRAEEIRSFLVDVCHGAGLRAREWAAAHGAGTEADHRPFLRLAEVCADANLYLDMVSGVLVVDPERVRRRWTAIEALVHEARGLAEAARRSPLAREGPLPSAQPREGGLHAIQVLQETNPAGVSPSRGSGRSG